MQGWTILRLITVITLLSLAVTGCDLLDLLATPSPSPQRQIALTPSPSQPEPTLVPLTPTPETISPIITLTLWTTEALSPARQDLGGQILKEQYNAFMAANPDIGIQYELKRPYEKGGILDFLLTTSAAVPEMLPDLVAIDILELGEATRLGITQPLDELISAELQNDLYPFARQACRFEGRLMALQFEADIEHLIYNTDKIEKPPSTWADLLAGEASYIFPAGGSEGAVNDVFLIQYFALGGRLFDEAGHPAPDRGKIAQVLQFYKDGLDEGLIPRSVLELETADDAWPIYLAAEAAMTNVSSQRYSADRGQLKNTAFAPIPTKDGNASTIGRGWAYAIITRDPRRQAAAAKFIEWLMAPQNLAPWSQATNHLPTRRSALALAAEDDYTTFLNEQLERAHFRPSLPAYGTIAQALQEAVQEVLTGEATPEEAAAEVMAAIE